MRLITNRHNAHHLGAAQAVSSTQSVIRRTSWYGVFIALIVGVVAVSTACWLNSEDVLFTFDNRTDSPLCYDLSPEDASGGRCSQEVKPLAETAWHPGCGSGPGVKKNPITVVLTIKQGGRQIYNRTAECRVWQDSDRTFVIEQRGGDFVVTDPFTDAPPTP